MEECELPEVATADKGYSVSSVALDWVWRSCSYTHARPANSYTHARPANTYASTTDAHAHARAANTYTRATD